MALKRRTTTHKPSRKWMVIMTLTALLVIVGMAGGYRYYQWFFASNVQINNEEGHYVYIPNHATFEEVTALIEREKLLINASSFQTVAQLMKYPESIKAGRYLVTPHMSNHQLITMLRAGRQSPVKFTFNNIRTREDLAHIVSQKLMTDSVELVALLNNTEYLKKFNLTPTTALTLFIPNSYEIYWTTHAEGFLERMQKEHNRFWNEKRMQMAASANLTPTEVSILASIVDEETQKNDEKPIVAGLYLNRLRKGIMLQADPTVKFALGDFAIKRILTKDLEIDSPFNTYKHAGLPPGPIRIASISGIDAVLNAEKHEYYYMCAKEDFSGYHNFAKTLSQHNANAARYRNALRVRKIWR